MTTNDEFNTTIDRLNRARDAFDIMRRMTAPCDCKGRDCLHTHASTAQRDLLCDRDAGRFPSAAPHLDPPAYIYDFMRALFADIDAAPYQTDELSRLALDHSLCPMHHCDYAACFDDDDPECAAIRDVFPSHDT